MADSSDTRSLPILAASNEETWKAHEAEGYRWHDPLAAQKQRLLNQVLRDLGIPKPRVLDYGCGDGTFAAIFDSLGCHSCGVDISETALRHARERFPSLTFALIGPGGAAPYPDESFDVMYCSEVIEHVYDVHAVFGFSVSSVGWSNRIGGSF